VSSASFPSIIVNADNPGIERTARVIANGGLVAFPTETVYGLGANARDDRAVAQIFEAKNRPRFNPLIVHVPTMEDARRLAEFDDRAEEIANAFWPGPLSIVLPRRADAGLSFLVSAGLNTIALRVPDSELARELLTVAQCPIAAPSANRSGEVSPTTAEHVAQSLPEPGDKGPSLILDGGPCSVGLESTVVDLSEPMASLLRPGGITREDLACHLGTLVVADSDDTAPRSPGMMTRHYAPATPLRINATTAEPGEALLGFGDNANDAIYNLSPDGNLTEAAANLFAMLRDLDNGTHAGIAVAPIPKHGLGQAINDRLKRAAKKE
tara:strand:+ start:558 stop:1532 length:975 start_codon:yes stop_codon:yes gene_type:complete